MPKEIYKCEKCGTEFEDLYLCISHESECINEQDTINLNYKIHEDRQLYNLF
jgi:DNA-directed RNA polymerase subunit RPC12/RpoP